MSSDPDRLVVAVECRASDAGPMLRATIIQEGRAATGGRAEVFAPGAMHWPDDGIAIRTVHLGPEVARAVPTREANGEIRIETPASSEIMRAVEQDGKRYASVEFHGEREHRTRGGVREIQRAMLTGAALVARPEYDMARAEVRARALPPRWWTVGKGASTC